MITSVQSQTPEISTVDALWTLIQGQSKRVRQALIKRLLAEHKTKAQQKMVADTLTKAKATGNPVWVDYQLSPEILGMGPREPKPTYGYYKEQLATILEEKYR